MNELKQDLLKTACQTLSMLGVKTLVIPGAKKQEFLAGLTEVDGMFPHMELFGLTLEFGPITGIPEADFDMAIAVARVVRTEIFLG